MKLTALLAGILAATGISLAAPADADDYDTQFMQQIHTFGIYGPQDYDAWLAKIACDRLGKGVDANAYQSATFLQRNLPRGTTQAQSFQFLGAAIGHYCPELAPRLQEVGVQHG
ncbi:DUF732 domain-containing protein [Mycobacterium botniense]|uniref:DUF732 domain-containing protein n=1 Tax=Mycobacterium botniense TaxID=84962 RepID=A0A7I9XTF7_9MYCO|nr:DUF732 domain-containing protein [Mycobacterium botniense]GFG73301.1 hypothetical protein MBOT_06660 [Mycobacterium botniense]